jgi:hypothetical protein
MSLAIGVEYGFTHAVATWNAFAIPHPSVTCSSVIVGWSRE